MTKQFNPHYIKRSPASLAKAEMREIGDAAKSRLIRQLVANAYCPLQFVGDRILAIDVLEASDIEDADFLNMVNACMSISSSRGAILSGPYYAESFLIQQQFIRKTSLSDVEVLKLINGLLFGKIERIAYFDVAPRSQKPNARGVRLSPRSLWSSRRYFEFISNTPPKREGRVKEGVRP